MRDNAEPGSRRWQADPRARGPYTGGLAFLLRDLSVPVYGSALTLGWQRHRVEEAGLEDRARFIEVADGERRMACGSFRS